MIQHSKLEEGPSSKHIHRYHARLCGSNCKNVKVLEDMEACTEQSRKHCFIHVPALPYSSMPLLVRPSTSFARVEVDAKLIAPGVVVAWRRNYRSVLWVALGVQLEIIITLPLV